MRPIRLHDSRTGRIADLEPREPGKVGIYACGPTVYGRIHVGNARPFVVFSLLKRFLEHEGYATTLVANVTDINDKIYTAARDQGVPSDELAQDMTAAYFADTDGLGLGRPDGEPLATETVPEIVGLIEALIERDHAYEREGDVYFRVRSHPEYGELSHRDVDQMDQGEGIEGADRKEDPLDFALWKATKETEDTAWDSPWGRGRPGWHIECSAMAEKLLGLDFEIHGGGADLLFPHHENEAAQTLAGRGTPLARVWMHNGMIELDTKMSKSLGNIVALHAALAEHGRDALVMYFCGGHYRRPMPWREDVLADARARVERFREAGRRLVPGESPAELSQHREAFFAALADDFNTPEALAAAHAWINEANRRDGVGDADLREMLGVLALENLLDADDGAPEDLVEKARQRETARAARDFATADRLRDELRAAGWEVRDSADGPQLVPRWVIIYGRNPVREALRGRRRVAQVWATKGAATEPWLEGVRLELARGDEIEARCGSEAHQGICADAGPYPYVDAAALLGEPEPFLVALDEVTDPQNLGAVCRTAEVSGASGVVIPERRSAEVTSAVCKASAGAVEHLPVARVRNLADFLGEAKAAGCWTYGAAAAATTPYRAPDYRDGVVLVLGAEGKGLRPRVASLCDDLIALPVRGKLDSLNVSAAAAVVMYEILQQRLDSGS